MMKKNIIRFYFGKYSGCPVDEVFKFDISYCNWVKSLLNDNGNVCKYKFLIKDSRFATIISAIDQCINPPHKSKKINYNKKEILITECGTNCPYFLGNGYDGRISQCMNPTKSPNFNGELNEFITQKDKTGKYIDSITIHHKFPNKCPLFYKPKSKCDLPFNDRNYALKYKYNKLIHFCKKIIKNGNDDSEEAEELLKSLGIKNIPILQYCFYDGD